MSNLEEKVKSWITEQGYPLEMLVAKKYREAGFQTTQSEYFVDPESGDNREIDVVAFRQAAIGEIIVRISVCIECKVSNKHPWIIFTSEDTKIASPASIIQRPTTRLGYEFLNRISHNKYAHNTPFFKLNKRNGHGLTEAFTNGKDNAYSSCISVAKCARSLIEKAETASNQQGPICEITLPIVLLEGKLFECHQDNTDIEVNEITHSTLIWRNQASNAGHSIISVYTTKALTKLINDTNRFADFIFSQTDTFESVEKDHLSKYENRWRHLQKNTKSI